MKSGYETQLKRILRLNRQLSEFQSKRVKLFALKVIISEIFVLALFSYIYAQLVLYSQDNTYVVWVLCPFVCLIVPLLFNPYAIFKNKKHGKITKLELDSRLVESKNSMKAVRETLVLEITFVDERERIYDVELGKQHQNCFFVGDDIIYLNSLPYPINLTEHDNVVCPYCGNVMPAVNRECLGCGKLNIYKNR